MQFSLSAALSAVIESTTSTTTFKRKRSEEISRKALNMDPTPIDTSMKNGQDPSPHDHLEPSEIDKFLLSSTVTDMMQSIPSLLGTPEREVDSSSTDGTTMNEASRIVQDFLDSTGETQNQDNDAAITEKFIEIWEPLPDDVLTGRGASINLNPGNQKFRALCYAHKPIFDVANHAAKKRIAGEIWTTCQKLHNSRFLSKRSNSNVNSPWIQQTTQSAILKVAQTIRDYQRPDRIIQRQLSQNVSGNCSSTNGDVDGAIPTTTTTCVVTKKRRVIKSATPMDHVSISQPPEVPIDENPDGVETNDVLCGRGAFVNGHYGNKYLRELAIARKTQFDAASFIEKRMLAKEIVNIIHQLQPPGRFLSLAKAKPNANAKLDTEGNEGSVSVQSESNWEEVSIDKAIMKACQVMRDMDRPDRKHRLERKLARMNRLQVLHSLISSEPTGNGNDHDHDNKDDDRIGNDEKSFIPRESNHDIVVGDVTNNELQQQRDESQINRDEGSGIYSVADDLVLPIDGNLEAV